MKCLRNVKISSIPNNQKIISEHDCMQGIMEDKYRIISIKTINDEVTCIVEKKPKIKLQYTKYHLTEAKIISHDPNSYTEKISDDYYIVHQGMFSSDKLDEYLVFKDKYLAEKVKDKLNMEVNRK